MQMRHAFLLIITNVLSLEKENKKVFNFLYNTRHHAKKNPSLQLLPIVELNIKSDNHAFMNYMNIFI